MHSAYFKGSTICILFYYILQIKPVANWSSKKALWCGNYWKFCNLGSLSYSRVYVKARYALYAFHPRNVRPHSHPQMVTWMTLPPSPATNPRNSCIDLYSKCTHNNVYCYTPWVHNCCIIYLLIVSQVKW